MTLKRISSLLFMSLFFSLQVFQLCDESHDAYEALISKVQLLSHPNVTIKALRPVDDPDADLPLVLGRSLSHGRITCKTNWVSHLLLPKLGATGATFVSEIPACDHSPPWTHTAGAAPPLHSILLSRSSTRILAPPLS